MIVLTYGVWNDGAVQVGSANRRKSLRPARYTSMVEAASPCAPTWAMNRVTFSSVIGCGARWNWEVNFWYLDQPALYVFIVDFATPDSRKR